MYNKQMRFNAYNSLGTVPWPWCQHISRGWRINKVCMCVGTWQGVVVDSGCCSMSHLCSPRGKRNNFPQSWRDTAWRLRQYTKTNNSPTHQSERAINHQPPTQSSLNQACNDSLHQHPVNHKPMPSICGAQEQHSNKYVNNLTVCIYACVCVCVFWS